MNNEQSAPSAKPGVSPARRVASVVFLIIAIVVLLVELRASLGQSSSAEALAAKAPDGLFPEGIVLAQGEALMAMFPEVSTVRKNEQEVVRCYRWRSLLKPLLNKPESEIYLVSRPTEPEQLLAFYTDREDAEKGFYGDPTPVSEDAESMGPGGDLPPDPFGIPDASAATESNGKAAEKE